ncbi:hypothetical protein XENTR_v10010903 [Xenopus tropicalis]|nr:hypothetical protein XENTR_v10010903 [Xenopus tropicalis]
MPNELPCSSNSGEVSGILLGGTAVVIVSKVTGEKTPSMPDELPSSSNRGADSGLVLGGTVASIVVGEADGLTNKEVGPLVNNERLCKVASVALANWPSSGATEVSTPHSALLELSLVQHKIWIL